MARNACVRSRRGSGDWIGHTDIWNDPRAQLEAQPAAAAVARPVNTITEKQMSYLKSLIDSRMVSSTETTKTIAAATKQTANTLYKNGGLSKSVASQLIAALAAVR